MLSVIKSFYGARSKSKFKDFYKICKMLMLHWKNKNLLEDEIFPIRYNGMKIEGNRQSTNFNPHSSNLSRHQSNRQSILNKSQFKSSQSPFYKSKSINFPICRIFSLSVDIFNKSNFFFPAVALTVGMTCYCKSQKIKQLHVYT